MAQWTCYQPTGISWGGAGLATPWQEAASGLISTSGRFYALDIGISRGGQLPGPPESSHACGFALS